MQRTSESWPGGTLGASPGVSARMSAGCRPEGPPGATEKLGSSGAISKVRSRTQKPDFSCRLDGFISGTHEGSSSAWPSLSLSHALRTFWRQ